MTADRKWRLNDDVRVEKGPDGLPTYATIVALSLDGAKATLAAWGRTGTGNGLCFVVPIEDLGVVRVPAASIAGIAVEQHRRFSATRSGASIRKKPIP
jgi:hypothetical protein